MTHNIPYVNTIQYIQYRMRYNTIWLPYYGIQCNIKYLLCFTPQQRPTTTTTQKNRETWEWKKHYLWQSWQRAPEPRRIYQKTLTTPVFRAVRDVRGFHVGVNININIKSLDSRPSWLLSPHFLLQTKGKYTNIRNYKYKGEQIQIARKSTADVGAQKLFAMIYWQPLLCNIVKKTTNHNTTKTKYIAIKTYK